MIRYELLSDLEPEDYLFAIKEFCRTQEEIYPNTGIIAILRKHALGHAAKRKAKEQIEVFRQTESDEEVIPMPVWFKEKLVELGKRMSVH